MLNNIINKIVSRIRFNFVESFILISLLGIASSCTAPIDIDTDESDPVIVIYSVITEELTHQSVRLSSSSPYFSNESNPLISGAIVQIESSGDKIFIFQESDTAKGLYFSEELMAGVQGVSYKLTVDVDFDGDGIKERYEANMTMPYKIELDSIELEKKRIMGKQFYAVNIYGEEPPTEDYYLFKYAVNDSLISGKISKYECSSDEFFNGEYINAMTVRYFNDIENEDDYDDDDNEDRVFLTAGDKVTLTISRIEKGYFDFVTQCQNEMYGENPFFGGPASNIYTNITNGGVGYFTGYCSYDLHGIVP